MTDLRCRRCKRPMRGPTPSGLGPVCEQRTNPSKPRKPAMARSDPTSLPPVPVMPGQIGIDLVPFQPTLDAI